MFRLNAICLTESTYSGDAIDNGKLVLRSKKAVTRSHPNRLVASEFLDFFN